MLTDGSLEINSLVFKNCFSYRNVFQNGTNFLLKFVLKNPFFCQKTKNSCSLDYTILFKYHLQGAVYSTLWDTLKMMLFTKYFAKWKHISRISWNFRCWFDLKILYEIKHKKINVILVQCPFNTACPRKPGSMINSRRMGVGDFYSYSQV